jgi:hypothetical protein
MTKVPDVLRVKDKVSFRNWCHRMYFSTKHVAAVLDVSRSNVYKYLDLDTDINMKGPLVLLCDLITDMPGEQRMQYIVDRLNQSAEKEPWPAEQRISNILEKKLDVVNKGANNLKIEPESKNKKSPENTTQVVKVKNKRTQNVLPTVTEPVVKSGIESGNVTVAEIIPNSKVKKKASSKSKVLPGNIVQEKVAPKKGLSKKAPAKLKIAMSNPEVVAEVVPDARHEVVPEVIPKIIPDAVSDAQAGAAKTKIVSKTTPKNKSKKKTTLKVAVADIVPDIVDDAVVDDVNRVKLSEQKTDKAPTTSLGTSDVIPNPIINNEVEAPTKVLYQAVVKTDVAAKHDETSRARFKLKPGSKTNLSYKPRPGSKLEAKSPTSVESAKPVEKPEQNISVPNKTDKIDKHQPKLQPNVESQVKSNTPSEPDVAAKSERKSTAHREPNVIAKRQPKSSVAHKPYVIPPKAEVKPSVSQKPYMKSASHSDTKKKSDVVSVAPTSQLTSENEENTKSKPVPKPRVRKPV